MRLHALFLWGGGGERERGEGGAHASSMTGP